MSWKQFGEGADGDAWDDETPTLTLGQLDDGDTVELEVAAEPEEFHSDEYGPGLRVEATLTAASRDVEHNNTRIPEGTEVVMVTWSKRLGRALARYAGDDALAGETIEVEKHQNGDEYSTEYTVREA